MKYHFLQHFLPGAIQRSVLILLFINCTAYAVETVPFVSDSGLRVTNPSRMHVVIQRLDSDDRKAGLSERLIRSKVELALQEYGISPNTKLPYEDGYLYVRIERVGEAFSCDLKFNRIVSYKSRGRVYDSVASMWSEGVMGIFDGDRTVIFRALEDQMALFINAYLEANRQYMTIDKK